MNEAVPPIRAALPITVVPSRKSTVPVALPGATVAVKVTDSPKLDGFCDESIVVVVAPWFTVWVIAAEVLPVKFASPL